MTFYKRCLCVNIFLLGKYPGKDCWVIGKCVLNLIAIVVQLLSCVLLSATTWTVSMGFRRQESWRGCHFILQWIFLGQGLNWCSCIGRWILYHSATRKVHVLKLIGSSDQTFKDVSNLTPTRCMHTLAPSHLPTFGNVRFLYCFGFFLGGGAFQCVK